MEPGPSFLHWSLGQYVHREALRSKHRCCWAGESCVRLHAQPLLEPPQHLIIELTLSRWYGSLQRIAQPTHHISP